MTKETKIGLLVGLTFIILFAIILSEKGATNNATQPSNLTVVDGSRPGGSIATRSNQPLAGVGNMPIESTVPPVTGTINNVITSSVPLLQERPIGIPIPRSEGDIQPLPTSVVDRLNLAQMSERVVKVDTVGPQPDMSVSLERAVEGARHGIPANDRRLAMSQDAETDPIRAILSDTSRGETRPVEPVRTAPVRIVAEHEVKSGESLGKIAAKYFGRSTPSRINAIFDANRDRLASVHSVRVGDKLRIPAIPDADGFVDASGFSPATVINNPRESEVRVALPKDVLAGGSASAPRPAVESTPKFSWYEVRENDTLSRIAKREMGNDRLYLKLYEANKDILPNKNAIKPGMKIRIPIDHGEEQVSSTDFQRPR